MLYSLALIFIFGIIIGNLFKQFNFPSLLGMLIVGIIIGPYAFNLLDLSVLNISLELRKIALIVILIRAGLNLDIDDLKKVGRPAILMSFIPACFEIIGTVVLAPLFLGFDFIESLVLGSVIAAVSPAVIVPKMLKLLEEGYGKVKSIPQMILASATVDDIFVIVLFTSFTGLSKSGLIHIEQFVMIPISIILGLIIGAITGMIIQISFSKIKVNNTVKALILLSTSFLLVTLESQTNIFSSLLAIMTMGIVIRLKQTKLSGQLSNIFSNLWIGAEIILFVLVGASVNINYIIKGSVVSVVFLFFILIFRMMGVLFSLFKTNLNAKERLFTAMSYIPKATVQAAIGGLPLAMGLSKGEEILVIAVLSIIITAPLGAYLIDLTHKKMLIKEEQK